MTESIRDTNRDISDRITSCLIAIFWRKGKWTFGVGSSSSSSSYFFFFFWVEIDWEIFRIEMMM